MRSFSLILLMLRARERFVLAAILGSLMGSFLLLRAGEGGKGQGKSVSREEKKRGCDAERR